MNESRIIKLKFLIASCEESSIAHGILYFMHANPAASSGEFARWDSQSEF